MGIVAFMLFDQGLRSHMFRASEAERQGCVGIGVLLLIVDWLDTLFFSLNGCRCMYVYVAAASVQWNLTSRTIERRKILAAQYTSDVLFRTLYILSGRRAGTVISSTSVQQTSRPSRLIEMFKVISHRIWLLHPRHLRERAEEEAVNFNLSPDAVDW